MTFNWQDAVALVLVLAAAGYLARKGWQVLAAKKSSGCGSCSNCPTEAAPGKQIISISALSGGAPSSGPAASRSNQQTP